MDKRGEFATLDNLTREIIESEHQQRVEACFKRRVATGRLGSARDDYDPHQAQRPAWWRDVRLWSMAVDPPEYAIGLDADGMFVTRKFRRVTEIEALRWLYIHARGGTPAELLPVITVLPPPPVVRGVKTCYACKRDLPYTMFHERKDTADGLQSYCKTCQSETNRTNRHKRKRVQETSAYSRAKKAS